MDAPVENAAVSAAPKGKASAITLGTLSVVSTPIGNPEDISLRAIKTLKQADVVVGEEGKTVARLLYEHRITKKIEELNEHNEQEQTKALLQALSAGKNLALVSDAGTPLLADPGAQLVKKAIEKGVVVRAVPGVTSVMTALTTSGLPMDSFVFAGFLSREPGERLQELKRLAQEPRTVVVLETPYRLVPLLEAARQIIPQRRAYLGCNLTMDSETHHYGTVSDLYTKFLVSRFKGEFVFCFEGVSASSRGADDRKDDRKEEFSARSPQRRDFDRGRDRKEGFRKEGFKKEGFKKEGFRQDGFKRDGFKKEGFKKEGFRQDGFKKEGFRKDGAKRDNYAGDGFKKPPFKKEPFKKEPWKKDSFKKGDGKNRETGATGNADNAASGQSE